MNIKKKTMGCKHKFTQADSKWKYCGFCGVIAPIGSDSPLENDPLVIAKSPMFNFTEDDIKRAYREGFYRALNGDAGFTEDEFIKILKTMK
jgi:hypothetical protein